MLLERSDSAHSGSSRYLLERPFIEGRESHVHSGLGQRWICVTTAGSHASSVDPATVRREVREGRTQEHEGLIEPEV